ncbi:hypothetical protein JOM56_005730 [Amanita muscaria]
MEEPETAPLSWEETSFLDNIISQQRLASVPSAVTTIPPFDSLNPTAPTFIPRQSRQPFTELSMNNPQDLSLVARRARRRQRAQNTTTRRPNISPPPPTQPRAPQTARRGRPRRQAPRPQRPDPFEGFYDAAGEHIDGYHDSLSNLNALCFALYNFEYTSAVTSSKQKFKRVPHLIFDDKLLNDPTMESLQAIPPNTIWFPPKNYTIKWISERGALYNIHGLRVKEAFWNSFTWFGKVHIDSLVLDKPNPMFAEINLFSWGFVMQEVPYIQGFLWHSYEIFTRAPLAVGHRVSVEPTRCAPDDVLIFPDVSMPAEKVGTVTDIHFDTVSVQDSTTGVIEEIPVRDLRRIFNIGDTVKAHSPVSLHHPNLEGWVVNTDKDVVTVVHGKTKEQVSVKSWQLVPIELNFILHENSINSRVVIGGLHHEKGLRGRVREHVGHQIMRIELESSMRLVDVHINQLLSTNNSGARLRHYYVHNHEYHAMPVVDYATTETLHGPLVLTLAPSTMPPRSTTPIPEDVEEVDNVWNPSYIPEGMVVEETDVIPVQAPPTLIFKDRVLAHDWLFHAGLANKRIYVRVVNSRPSATSAGFEHGFLEGEEGMIISAEEGLNAVLIHLLRSKQSQRIPLRFLWPQAPWRKALAVVVLEGDRLGEVFVTRELTSENLFPLAQQVQSRGKAAPICFLPPSALARCDPK